MGTSAYLYGLLRACDADRDRTLDRLADAYATGRLDADEHSERVDTALRAHTVGELADLVADLHAVPALRPPSAAPSGASSAGPNRRAHAAHPPAGRAFAALLAFAVGLVTVGFGAVVAAGFGAAERGPWPPIATQRMQLWTVGTAHVHTRQLAELWSAIQTQLGTSHVLSVSTSLPAWGPSGAAEVVVPAAGNASLAATYAYVDGAFHLLTERSAARSTPVDLNAFDLAQLGEWTAQAPYVLRLPSDAPVTVTVGSGGSGGPTATILVSGQGRTGQIVTTPDGTVQAVDPPLGRR